MALRQRSILVLDHDQPFLELMQELLAERGFQVRLLRDPLNAYAEIKRVPPDVLIIDLQLEHPQANWVALDTLRLDPQTATIPVIVTATDERFLREKEATLRRHHVGILAKPFDLDELLCLIDSLIRATSRQS